MAMLQMGAASTPPLGQCHISGGVHTSAVTAVHPLLPLTRPPSAPTLQHSHCSADAAFAARQHSAPPQPLQPVRQSAAPCAIRHSHSADAAIDVSPSERLPKHGSRCQQLMHAAVSKRRATEPPASAFASPEVKPPAPLPPPPQQPPLRAAPAQPQGITPAPTDDTKLSLPSLSPADFAAIFAAVSGRTEHPAEVSPVSALSPLLPGSRLTAHSLESADTASVSRLRDSDSDSR